jgi:hypothetical protein
MNNRSQPRQEAVLPFPHTPLGGGETGYCNVATVPAKSEQWDCYMGQ